MPPIPLDERLPALHAHYTARVNAAIAAGRMDLVRDLADECQDEALALILEAEGGSGRNNGAVEVLEAGGWSRWRVPYRRGRWRRR
jgi:hypothetical protein